MTAIATDLTTISAHNRAMAALARTTEHAANRHHEQFVAAWREWDRHPANPDTAGAFENLVQAEALRLDINPSTLRDRLNGARRAGMTRAEAACAVLG